MPHTIRIRKTECIKTQDVALSADRVVAELARIGFADSNDFAAWHAAGTPVKLSDKLKALELLGRHFGIFTEKADASFDPTDILLARKRAGIAVEEDKAYE